MKLVMLSITMLMVTSAFANDPLDSAPACLVYDGVNLPREAKLTESTRVSAAMKSAMGAARSLTQNSNKYEVDGLSIELTQSLGCAKDCWDTRHILVTQNGVSAYVAGNKADLKSLYPTIKMIVGESQLAFQCRIPSK
jgi:hypothetical protein